MCRRSLKDALLSIKLRGLRVGPAMRTFLPPLKRYMVHGQHTQNNFHKGLRAKRWVAVSRACIRRATGERCGAALKYIRSSSGKRQRTPASWLAENCSVNGRDGCHWHPRRARPLLLLSLVLVLADPFLQRQQPAAGRHHCLRAVLAASQRRLLRHSSGDLPTRRMRRIKWHQSREKVLLCLH